MLPIRDILPKNYQTILNLHPNEIDRVERKLSTKGLKEKCDKDFVTLQALGISFDQIRYTLLAHIERVQVLGKRKFTNIQIIKSESDDDIEKVCPFAKQGKGICHSGSSKYTIINEKSNKVVEISELGIQLLSHGYFEKGINPVDLCEVLEIQPDPFETTVLKQWKLVFVGNYSKSIEQRVHHLSTKTKKIDETARAYLELPFVDLNNYMYRRFTEKERIIIETQSRGGTDEDVKNSLAWHRAIFKTASLDWPVYTDYGNRYLHVFVAENHRSHFGERTEIGGRTLTSSLECEGHYVFQKENKTVAKLD